MKFPKGQRETETEFICEYIATEKVQPAISARLEALAEFR
jgi:hypothetical protein